MKKTLPHAQVRPAPASGLRMRPWSIFVFTIVVNAHSIIYAVVKALSDAGCLDVPPGCYWEEFTGSLGTLRGFTIHKMMNIMILFIVIPISFWQVIRPTPSLTVRGVGVFTILVALWYVVRPIVNPLLGTDELYLTIASMTRHFQVHDILIGPMVGATWALFLNAVHEEVTLSLPLLLLTQERTRIRTWCLWAVLTGIVRCGYHIHQGAYMMPMYVGMSVIGALSLRDTKSLWPMILAHFVLSMFILFDNHFGRM